MLFKNPQPEPKLAKLCVEGDLQTSLYMFRYQREIQVRRFISFTLDSTIWWQMALVVLAVMMVPVMLLGKPITILLSRNSRRGQNYSSIGEGEDDVVDDDPDKQEEGFGDIMIIQGEWECWSRQSVLMMSRYPHHWVCSWLHLSHCQLLETLGSLSRAQSTVRGRSTC